MNTRVLVLVLLFMSKTCLPCTCIAASPSFGMEKAEVVFGATAVGARLVGDHVDVDVQGLAPLKGDASRLHRLRTPSSRSACGYVVRIPERYIFFASKDGSFDACGATRLLSDSELGDLMFKAIKIWTEQEKGK